jgi:hypothetical protein
MNKKTLLVLAGFIVGLTVSGCKKDDSPTTPQAPGAPYGSGTITTMSTAGSLSLTGTGAWPFGTGPSVLAVYDTSIHAFFVYGYQQVSGPLYNVIALVAFMPAPDTGTYSHPGVLVAVAYNADTTMHSDSVAYQSVSGSMSVTSVNGSNALGMYSVMARKGTAAPIQFAGTFNVNFVVGLMPGRDSAQGREPWLRLRLVDAYR